MGRPKRAASSAAEPKPTKLRPLGPKAQAAMEYIIVAWPDARCVKVTSRRNLRLNRPDADIWWVVYRDKMTEIDRGRTRGQAWINAAEMNTLMEKVVETRTSQLAARKAQSADRKAKLLADQEAKNQKRLARQKQPPV